MSTKKHRGIVKFVACVFLMCVIAIICTAIWAAGVNL